jgi:hypothetical protein
VELIVGVVVLVLMAAVLAAILRLVGAILSSRFFWGLVIAGCCLVGANSPDLRPWCIGVGIIALVAFWRLGRAPYDPGPVRSNQTYNFPVQADQVYYQSLPPSTQQALGGNGYGFYKGR